MEIYKIYTVWHCRYLQHQFQIQPQSTQFDLPVCEQEVVQMHEIIGKVIFRVVATNPLVCSIRNSSNRFPRC